MSDNTTTYDEHKASFNTRLVLPAGWQDPVTGATYVHHDLVPSSGPWAVDEHIPPVRTVAQLGDVESWVQYVLQFGAPASTHLVWSDQGLAAILDYHSKDAPARCGWQARHAFKQHATWQRWRELANGRPRSQREIIETLEDLAEDIVFPDAAALTGLLRTLRALVNAQADSELRPDGTSRVTWSRNQQVAGEVALPSSFVIAVPVLRGHSVTTDNGEAPVIYRVDVRLRVSVTDDARLAFRLSMPQAERVVDAAVADRVEMAKRMLGPEFSLLRGHEALECWTTA